MKIAVVAPSCTLKREAADGLRRLPPAAATASWSFHPQCFLSDGHFAGSDAERLAALREVMADASVDAVWFARGGYGSNRIAEAALADLPEAARSKTLHGLQRFRLPARRDAQGRARGRLGTDAAGCAARRRRGGG